MVLAINNNVCLQWSIKTANIPGPSALLITLPISYSSTNYSVVGNSTDHNDAYVNVLSCYNFTDSGYSYIIGNNGGSYCSEECYFIIIC